MRARGGLAKKCHCKVYYGESDRLVYATSMMDVLVSAKASSRRRGAVDRDEFATEFTRKKTLVDIASSQEGDSWVSLRGLQENCL